MSNFQTIVIAGLFASTAANCTAPIASPTPNRGTVAIKSTVAGNLLEQLIDALNSKDGSDLEPFIKAHATTTVTVADRVDRMKGLAEQGAPFKIVRIIPGNSDEIKALITDKNGMELSFRISLTKDAEPKIDRVAIGPSEGGATAKSYLNWTNLQSLTDTIKTDSKAPAMGLGVLRNGKYEQAVSGVREDGKTEVVTTEEPWSIGSIGKPICSSVIGHLIETGKLRWDETLGEALKGVPMKEAYKNVTLDQIMHHRGGIPQDPGMRKPDLDRIIAGATEATEMRFNYAKDILSRDPIAKPGERFAYSNAGYGLLGVVAERATGKSYEKLVHKFVFDPLGLKHSYTNIDKLPEARPTGHVPGPNGLQAMNSGPLLEKMFAPAGGGMFMSLQDMVKFGEAHMKGLQGKDGFLKAGTIKHLHQGIPEDEPAGRQYACGWGLERHRGIELMHTHNGSNGTMRAQLAIFPDSNLVVASFVNVGGESDPSPPLQAVLAVAAKYAAKP